MGDLFWNKVAGSILALFLFIMALGIIVDVVFSDGDDHGDGETHYGYPVDLSALESTAAEEPEAEGPVDFGALLMVADISAGERVARRCTSCHSFEQGGANGTGPALWDVMGRAVAGVDGFAYSGAFQDYAAGGTAWGYENMYNFLENPRQYIAGTAMSFAGLRDQEDRINMIAYLRSMSGDPIALPEPLPEAEETAVDEASAEDLSELTEAVTGEANEIIEETAEEVFEDGDTAVEGAEAIAEEDLPTITEVDQINSDDEAESEDTGAEDDDSADDGEEPGR